MGADAERSGCHPKAVFLARISHNGRVEMLLSGGYLRKAEARGRVAGRSRAIRQRRALSRGAAEGDRAAGNGDERAGMNVVKNRSRRWRVEVEDGGGVGSEEEVLRWCAVCDEAGRGQGNKSQMGPGFGRVVQVPAQAQAQTHRLQTGTKRHRLSDSRLRLIRPGPGTTSPTNPAHCALWPSRPAPALQYHTRSPNRRALPTADSHPSAEPADNKGHAAQYTAERARVRR